MTWDQVLLFIKSSLCSISWVIISLFFGLIQIWLFMLWGLFGKQAKVDIQSFFLDGTLLFFSSTIVIAITLDYYFNKRIVLPKLVSGFLFTLYPILIFGTSVYTYSLCVAAKQTLCLDYQ